MWRSFELLLVGPIARLFGFFDLTVSGVLNQRNWRFNSDAKIYLVEPSLCLLLVAVIFSLRFGYDNLDLT